MVFPLGISVPNTVLIEYIYDVNILILII